VKHARDLAEGRILPGRVLEIFHLHAAQAQREPDQ